MQCEEDEIAIGGGGRAGTAATAEGTALTETTPVDRQGNPPLRPENPPATGWMAEARLAEE